MKSRQSSLTSARTLWETVVLILVLGLLSGCGSRREDLAAIEAQDLASPTLLDMEVSNEVEASGTQMEDAYIWRSFESPNLRGEQLVQAIRSVGLDAGWTSWRCDKSGGFFPLEMRDGNPGFYAHVQVSDDRASVRVGKDRPGSSSGLSSDFADEDSFACE